MPFRIFLEPDERGFGSKNPCSRRQFGAALAWGVGAGFRDSIALLHCFANGCFAGGRDIVRKQGKGDEGAPYPPGSALKPFTLACLLRGGLLSVEETYFCPGNLRVAGHQLNCTHPRLALPMDVTRALAYSCNCAVAHWSARMPAARLAEGMREFGFDVDGRAPAALLALGEEGIEVAPRQLLEGYSRLRTEAALRPGLEAAVQFGTARAAALPHVVVAGKTGSAVARNGSRVAWFAGFAPSRAPEVAVTVLSAGSSGGGDAAPIARQMLEEYFGGRA